MTLKRLLDKCAANVLRHLMNIWPPFLGAGIKVTHIDKNFLCCEVRLKSGLLNKNYVGTHFGGSLFSMTDPFYMLMLLKNLGRPYIVWDKAASIKYIKPAYGTITGRFEFSLDELADIRSQADQQASYHFEKSVELLNKEKEVVAVVVRTLYVKRK